MRAIRPQKGLHSLLIIMLAYIVVSAYLSSRESRNPPKGVVFRYCLASIPSKASQNPDRRSSMVAINK